MKNLFYLVLLFSKFITPIFFISFMFNSNIFAQSNYSWDRFGQGGVSMDVNLPVPGIISQTTQATSSSNYYLVEWDSYWNKWSNTSTPYNEVFTLSFGGGGYAGSDGNLNEPTTTNKYYTLQIKGLDYSNRQAVLMETDNLPVNFHSLTPITFTSDVYPGQDLVIDVKLNSAKSSQEKVFVRYWTDDPNSSSLEEVTWVDDTDGTATIPGSYNTAGKTVEFYAYSTTVSAIDESDHDLITLNLSNDPGANFSYTVKSSWETTDGATNWNNTSSWAAGTLPLSGQPITIKHNLTAENVTVSNILTIDPAGSLDVSGTLTNNDSIVMQSSSSTSAALKAASISGSGTYKYQKYVAGSTTNDLITAPFSGESFSNLVDNNSGVLVQNTSPPTEYLFGPFDNDTGAYLTYDSATNALTTLSAGQGYRAGTTSGATLEFTGTFETTDQNVAINVGSDATYGKWNLVGNPFPSYLDLDGFLDDNNTGVIEDVNYAIYAYDGDDSNGSNWTIYSLNETSNVKIAPGQAFFVASSSGGGNLVFNTIRQTVTGGDDFLQRQAQTLDSFFKLNLESSNSLTHTDFYFNSNAGEGLDIGYDVGTYANLASSFSLYSKLASGAYSETNFAIQTISNDLSETVVIPLGVHISAGENHSISIDDVSLLESINVYLKDYETGTLTLLNNGAYSFSTDSNLEGISRFELRLTNTTLGLESDELMTNFKAVYQNDAVVLVGDFMLEDKVEIYDIMGRLTQSHTISGNHSIEITKDELSTGVYLAKINRNGNSKTIKFIIN